MIPINDRKGEKICSNYGNTFRAIDWKELKTMEEVEEEKEIERGKEGKLRKEIEDCHKVGL